MILTEELLTEILDSNFDVHRYNRLEYEINSYLKGKVHSAHTKVLQSDHMKKHGHAVLKLFTPNKTAEYHLLNTKGGNDKHTMDAKSMHHSLKIIKDDAENHLSKGHKVRLQANTQDQHENYGKLANRLIKNHPEHKVNDVGYTEKLDGTGKARTHIIEQPYYSPFRDIIINVLEGKQ
jgi:hypothetical protein